MDKKKYSYKVTVTMEGKCDYGIDQVKWFIEDCLRLGEECELLGDNSNGNISIKVINE